MPRYGVCARPPRIHPMRRLPVRSSGALGVLLFAGLQVAGCSPGTTPGFPTPDFQAPLQAGFPLRAGDLGYIQGAGDFLYLSIQSVGIDSRCPPESTCDEPGFLEVVLELETAAAQGSAGMQIPPSGDAVITYRGFEIRAHEVQPPGRASRIPPSEYVFLMSVSLR